MCSAISNQWQIKSSNIQLRAGCQRCNCSRTSSPEKLCLGPQQAVDSRTCMAEVCLALQLLTQAASALCMMTTTHMTQDPTVRFSQLDGAPTAKLLQNAFLCTATCFCGSRILSQQCHAQHVFVRTLPACSLHSRAAPTCAALLRNTLLCVCLFNALLCVRTADHRSPPDI